MLIIIITIVSTEDSPLFISDNSMSVNETNISTTANNFTFNVSSESGFSFGSTFTLNPSTTTDGIDQSSKGEVTSINPVSTTPFSFASDPVGDNPFNMASKKSSTNIKTKIKSKQ